MPAPATAGTTTDARAPRGRSPCRRSANADVLGKISESEVSYIDVNKCPDDDPTIQEISSFIYCTENLD
jgi:hypothetical protein